MQQEEPKYPLIPKQAFLLFPQGKEVIFQVKKTPKRMIFGDYRYPEYTEFEKTKITQFSEYLKKNKQTKLIFSQNQHTTLLKLIYANKFNYENACTNYKQFKRWQCKFIPTKIINPEYKQRMDNLLKTGVFYTPPTRDQFMKPIVIVHVGRLLKESAELELCLDSFGYFMQTMIEEMMIDGQLQTWNVIVDVSQISALTFAGALFDLIKFVSKIFIGRMYRCYVVDYPFFIKFIWGTVSMMMDAEQNEKCRILTNSQLIKLIPKQALEEKYGGDLKPLQHFWPLNSPERLQIQKHSYELMKNRWYESNRLVTQNQYYERAKVDKIGNKKCSEIINKFEAQLQETKKSQLLLSQTIQYVKLSRQESTLLNRKINVERLPLTIRVMNQLSASEQIGQLPLKKDCQTQKSVNRSRSKADSLQISNRVMAQGQKAANNLSSCENVFVRRQVFQQLVYQRLFK